MTKILFGLLIVSLILEGTITTMPLVLMSLMLLTIHLKHQDMFFYAFISGVILDVFLVRQIGVSSVFFLISLLLIFLYDRKYELQTPFFVTLITFFSTMMYFIIFPSPQMLVISVTTTLLSLFIFHLMRVFQPNVKKSYIL